MSEGVGRIEEAAAAVRAELRRVVVGQDEVIDEAMVAVFAGGHLLLEGPPGTAKTLIVRALARVLGCEFKRIQCTSDLMPSDIIGTNVYEASRGTFTLRKGPIFTELLLVDEVNRAPAKTQAALLEAMQEHQATIDGERYGLPDVFTVFATQNPIEYEGTYPLPEAQLDRFFFKVKVAYPAKDEETQILVNYVNGFDPNALDSAGVRAVYTRAEVAAFRGVLSQVSATPAMIEYITTIVRRTREWPTISVGASPRAAVTLLLAGRALAAIRGRSFITPDDVKGLASAALRHRVLLRPEAEIEGVGADEVVAEILASVPVPR